MVVVMLALMLCTASARGEGAERTSAEPEDRHALILRDPWKALGVWQDLRS